MDPFKYSQNIGDKKMSTLEDLKNRFNEKPVIIRILYCLVVIAFVYELIKGIGFGIYFSLAFLSLIIAEFINWFFFKKEE